MGIFNLCYGDLFSKVCFSSSLVLVRTTDKGNVMASQNQYQLTKSDLNNLKAWFFQYVQSFNSTDPIIQQALVLKEKALFKGLQRDTEYRQES